MIPLLFKGLFINVQKANLYRKKKKKKKVHEITVTLYLKPLCIMHYKSSYNALIMPCYTPMYNWYNVCIA